MKKVVTILTTLCLLGVITTQAQDTIRLTWKGSISEKTFEVRATAGTDNIAVSWGDGTTNTYNGKGNSNVRLSHTYGDRMSYNVVIATADANTTFTRLECDDNQLTALDVRQNPALTTLYCYSNQLTALDVRQNPALTYLYCFSNQLTALDVRHNPALITLYCYSNQLTALDVRQNPALTTLHCYSNQLTALDVRQNPALTHLYCDDNQLPLSQLYPIWKNKGINLGKGLNPQNIYDTIILNNTIDLSAELEFGSPAAQTDFKISMADNSSADDKHTFTNGMLTFTELGDYKVIMRNDSVRSGTSAEGVQISVTAHYHVREDVSIVEVETGAINIYPNPSNGQFQVISNKLQVERIDIYDISGKIVGANPGVCPENTIDISHLANGIYLVKVQTAAGEIVKKIVKN